MKFLCRLGLHKNRDLWRDRWTGMEQKVQWKCLRCGQEEALTLINPISGPRKGPMHPDIERTKAIEAARGKSV